MTAGVETTLMPSASTRLKVQPVEPLVATMIQYRKSLVYLNMPSVSMEALS